MLLVISMPTIFVNGQFYFNLSSKMWSHVFWNTVYMHITEVVKHIMSVMMLPVAGLTS